MKYFEIVKAYESLQSLEEVAHRYNISITKVKKILISEGAFENETSKRIYELYEAGKSVQEIAEILKVGKSCVNMYLPYKKCVYNADVPTENALNIRKSRDKRKRS